METEISRQQQGTPEQPVPPPPGMQAADHSWMLQVVFELQKSVGGLNSSVNTLSTEVRSQNAKVDELGEKVTKIVTIGTGVKWLIGVALGVAGLVLTAIAIAMYRLPAIISALRAL